MAEENVDVIENKGTSETIGLDGKPLSVSTGSLADLFGKMETVKNEGGSTAEILKSAESDAKSVARDGKVETKAEPEVKVEAEQKTETKTEPKVEAKTEPVKVEEKEVKKDELPDDELQVNPHDKPKTAQRIKQLWSKVKQWEEMATNTQRERDEKAAKLTELEKKLSEVKTVDPLTDERVKKQMDELAMYRRRYDLDKDPEVKTKYDSRIESAETTITEALKRRSASEDLLGLIKAEGGWQKFSESGRLVALPDGDGGVKHITSAELADAILSRLPLGERKSVEAAMLEQVQTKRDRERYFKEQQDKASEFFKQREEEGGKAAAEQQRQMEEAKKTVDTWRKTIETSDWLKDKELPANAPAAVKAEIEAYNKSNAQIKSILAKNLSAQKLEELLPVFEDSVKYHDERRKTSAILKENEALKAELKARTEEIQKFRKAGNSVSKGGSLSVTSAKDSDSNKKPASLEETFERMARGEKFVMRSDDNE